MRVSAVLRFVPRTQFPEYNVPLAAFASHHRKALADLRDLASQIDYVLELRDSRAPLSTINPLIGQALPGVPRITLYTKRDLSRVNASKVAPLHPDGHFRVISTEEPKYARQLLKDFKVQFNAQTLKPPLGFKILIAGMPNAGKSTLINMLRKVVFGKNAKKVAATAPTPGKTRATSEQILVSKDPKVYVVDTPGVLLPKVQDWEHMLKLALIGAVPTNLIDPIVLADYLLYHINLTYPAGGKYPGPQSNDIMEVLWSLAHKQRRKPSRETWDPNQTAIVWIQRYISGEICTLCLDDMSPNNVERCIETMAMQRHDLNSLLPAANLRKRPRSWRF